MNSDKAKILPSSELYKDKQQRQLFELRSYYKNFMEASMEIAAQE
jgi:hypothetical protein